MVVDTAQDRAANSEESPAAAAGRNYIRHILRALLELIELEFQIITLQLIAATRDVMIRVLLAMGALVFMVAGLVLLEITAFQALEKIIPMLWVFFIFAIGHLVLAGGLAFFAARPLSRKD